MDEHNDNKIKFLREFRAKSDKDALRYVIEGDAVAKKNCEGRGDMEAFIASRSRGCTAHRSAAKS